MNYDFDKGIYSKINNFDDEEYKKYISVYPNFKKDKKYIRNKTLKNNFLENFHLCKCLFLILIILLLFIVIIVFIDYNTKILNIHKEENILNSKPENKIKEKNLVTNGENENNLEEKPIRDEEEENEEEKKHNFEDIYKKEIFDSLNEAFNKAKDFLDKCIKGIIIQNKPFKSLEKPKVSAIIPLYNCRNYILRAIRSIQNQNIVDIEIILVNDYSTDDTLPFIEKIQEKDPRIRIIKNKKNMGILYSRSIGALHAKGKYIFPLDNDDMFLDKDVFKTITNIADKGSFDLVSFKGIFSLNGRSNLLNNKIQDVHSPEDDLNLVMFQPELGNYPIRSKTIGIVDFHDVLLWLKCIKTNIYQKALNKLGEKRYSRYILFYEDIIATCILFNTAKSYKFIGKYGTFHIQRIGSASWKSFNDVQINIYILYFLDIAIDFTQETFENKLLLVHMIIYLTNRPKLEKTLNDNYNKKLFISCYFRILNSNYISDENKNLIRQKVKQLNYLNFLFK